MASFVDVFEAAWGFGSGDEQRQHTASVVAGESPLGTYVRGEMAGTAMSFSMERTVPGQAQLPMAGISYVAVHPLRRRRGIMWALMRTNLTTCMRGTSRWRVWAPARPVSMVASGTDLRPGTVPGGWPAARFAARPRRVTSVPSNWSTWRRRETCSPPFMRKPAGPRWATCVRTWAGGTTSWGQAARATNMSASASAFKPVVKADGPRPGSGGRVLLLDVLAPDRGGRSAGRAGEVRPGPQPSHPPNTKWACRGEHAVAASADVLY